MGREAARRFARFGPNEIRKPRGRSLTAVTIGALREPMILLLLTATGLYLVFGHRVEGMFLAAARVALLGPEAAASGMVTVTAPASGYVTRVLQDSARTVAAGAPLIEVGDQNGLEAAVELPSQGAVRIREGIEAEAVEGLKRGGAE